MKEPRDPGGEARPPAGGRGAGYGAAEGPTAG